MIKNVEKQEFDFNLISNGEHVRFLSWRMTQSKPSFKKCNAQWRAMLESSSNRRGDGKCPFVIE